jgi:hypothetical protein
MYVCMYVNEILRYNLFGSFLKVLVNLEWGLVILDKVCCVKT